MYENDAMLKGMMEFKRGREDSDPMLEYYLEHPDHEQMLEYYLEHRTPDGPRAFSFDHRGMCFYGQPPIKEEQEDRRYWYDEVEDAICESCDISEKSYDDLLNALELELKEYDDRTIWLLNHYDSFAYELADNCEYMSEDQIEMVTEKAKKEIALLRKYGYDAYADRQQQTLDEAFEYIESMESSDDDEEEE